MWWRAVRPPIPDENKRSHANHLAHDYAVASFLTSQLTLANNKTPTDSHAAGYIIRTGTILSQKLPIRPAHWSTLSDLSSSTHLARTVNKSKFSCLTLRDESDYSLNSKITSFKRWFLHFTFSKEGDQQTFVARQTIIKSYPLILCVVSTVRMCTVRLLLYLWRNDS